MNFEERSRLHVAILQTLRTKAELGMPEPALHNTLRLVGYELALPALQVELRALADRNLISTFTPLGGARHRITALGESQLAEAGL